MNGANDEFESSEAAAVPGFLFSDVDVDSPLDELAKTFAARLETLRSLADDEGVRQYERAYELARKKLSELLTRAEREQGSW